MDALSIWLMTAPAGAVLEVVPPPPAWSMRARCIHADPDVFFPELGMSPAAAKQVCSACPVSTECAAFAVEHDLDGVWGGTTAPERRSRQQPAA